MANRSDQSSKGSIQYRDRLRRIGMKKKVSFELLMEIEKTVREEHEIAKNENESGGGVVEHSKLQGLGSGKICQKF